MLGLAALALSGCAGGTGGPGQLARFGLPEPVSDRAPFTGNLWHGFWIAALAIGVLMWGLMIWAAIRYRRRSPDEIPKQTRYNLPMEVMYTIVPFLIVGVLFFYTVNAQDGVRKHYTDAELAAQGMPAARTIGVIGQKWSWTFNYTDANVWDVGTVERIPDLYMQVDQPVNFTLDSPDVIHSFWVPQFYFKLDVIPGRTNSFQVTPTKIGSYAGKCAELCGTYHSRMLFNVQVVDQATYQAKMDELRSKGQTGQISYQTGTTQQVGSTQAHGGN